MHSIVDDKDTKYEKRRMGCAQNVRNISRTFSLDCDIGEIKLKGMLIFCQRILILTRCQYTEKENIFVLKIFSFNKHGNLEMRSYCVKENLLK